MPFTAMDVEDWARRMSLLPPGGPAVVVAALGVTGALVPRCGRTVVEPPPAGLRDLTLDERDGDVSAVDLGLAATVTRADLDATLGPGRELPRVHPFTPFPVGWFMEVVGAPFACAVVAHFDGPPTPQNPAVSVVLRRDRAHRTYPGHYAVDDVPVRLERLATGDVEARALDLRSGAFVAEPGCLLRLGRRDPGVEEIPAPVAERLVSALRRAASHGRQVTPMSWHSTGDPDRPWRADLDGTPYVIVTGDFPAEPRYTLEADGQQVDHLDTWPTPWTRD